MNDYAKERNKVFINAVVNDDWKAVRKFCKKYGTPIPKNPDVMKAGVYKAVQECVSIPQDIKSAAAIKCMDLGFNPFIKPMYER